MKGTIFPEPKVIIAIDTLLIVFGVCASNIEGVAPKQEIIRDGDIGEITQLVGEPNSGIGSRRSVSIRCGVDEIVSNLDFDFINVEESQVREHDRLLMGGVWAEIELGYDDAYLFKGQNRPFFVESIRPIQLSTRSIERFIEGRKRFTRDQWLDLLMRSMGYEPDHPYYTKRRKLHYLQRLVPLVERNNNSIELGPHGTGKSFAYQQLSPYCHLVSGGQTTTAQMFVNLSTGQRGSSRCGMLSPSMKRRASSLRTRTASIL